MRAQKGYSVLVNELLNQSKRFDFFRIPFWEGIPSEIESFD